ncbi:retrotransposon protein, putative, ty1-copia subclass [Tanacetum coccineum]
MFKKEKLSGNNFNDWFARLKLVLRVEKKMYVIEQPLPHASEPVAEPDIMAQWTALYDAHTEIACLMLGSMTPELHRQFELHYPYDMIQELRSMFEKQAGVEKFDLIQSFHACKQEEGKVDEELLYGAIYVESYNLPLSFWDYALESATRILNMVPTKKVDKTPYELWKVCKLQRSIYGLKQASRSWNKRFDEEIKRFGFTQNLDEPCVYQKASGRNVTFLILYVDDIIIMGNHIPSLQSVKDYLGKCFAMKDLGKQHLFLESKSIGIAAKRLSRALRAQNAYMDKILKRYKMDNSKRGHIPMQERLDLNKSQGSIMYAVRCTRPDVAFAQNMTSRFQQNPGEPHWTAVKNILKILIYIAESEVPWKGLD